MNNEEITWVKPTPSPSMDSLDQAIYAIGHVHGTARRESAMMSEAIYKAIRFEYLGALRLSLVITEDERHSVCNELENTTQVRSLLDILLNVKNAGEEKA
jgi:hypothetical protein